MVPPATTLVVPSFLVTDKLATCPTLIPTELLLLPAASSAVPAGGDMLAVLVSVPVAPGATLTWKVTVAT